MLNVLLGGSMNQTLSATQHQRKRDKKINFVWLIDIMFFWERGHCEDAWIKWQIIHKAINHYDTLGEIFFEKNKFRG